jgi:hypothetical protein
VVTWALHLAVLAAIAELELPLPDVGHLQEVDNLHLQVALADAAQVHLGCRERTPYPTDLS